MFLLLGLVTHDRVLSAKSCAYLVASLAAFVVGTVAARKIWQPRPRSTQTEPPGTILTATMVFLVAGSMVYLPL
jgi:hypothetical protein